jgi:2',3'-cyclic-nucleotide 2'-phosphodiesterase (5'-nucleotidase family)
MRPTALLLLCLIPLAGCQTTPPIATAPEPPRRETTPVSTAAGEDVAMIALLAPYRAAVEQWRGPIGQSAVTMEWGRRHLELGSWVADVIRARVAVESGGPVDFAFVNRGGLRATLHAGVVTYQNLAEVMPFENTLAYADVSGTQLLAIAEVLSRKRGAESISGGIIEGDGEFNLRSLTLDSGRPITPDGVYRVATIDYLAAGAGGFELLATKPFVNTGVLLRDAAADEVRRLAAEGAAITAPAETHRYRFDGHDLEKLHQ